MAKFIYKMQNILDIKRKLEEQEKIAYGIAAAKLSEEQEKLQRLLIRKAGYDKKARELVYGDISITDIKSCKKAVETMKVVIREQMFSVQAAEKNVEVARKRLSDVMVDRKTHEKLREREFEEFKQEIAYEENKMVDELVSYSYHSKE